MSAKCSRCDNREPEPGGKLCARCLAYGRARPKAPPKPTKVPAPPKSETRVVVGHMVPTEGARDDSCANYAACLTAHVRAHRGRREEEVPARCPFACRWYVEQEQAPATAFRSLNGACRGLPDARRMGT